MGKIFIVFQGLVFLLFFGCISCTPLVSRIKPGVVPSQSYLPAEDEQYGHEVLNLLTESYPLDRNDAHIARARKIVDQLTSVHGLSNSPWHVYVLVDDTFKNAAATRGNFIFVWTGMLNSVQNDDELAAILAHEIGHVLAKHTNPDPKKAVNEMLAGIAGLATRQSLLIHGSAPIVGDLAELVMREAIRAFIVNPELQRKELEADQVGLFLMADSGFDPAKAVEFWERVKKETGFSGFPLQFMSSHPSSEERIKHLRQLLPEAEKHFTPSGDLKGKVYLEGSPSEWIWK